MNLLPRRWSDAWSKLKLWRSRSNRKGMECIHKEQRYRERTTEVKSEHWSSLGSRGTFQFSPAFTHSNTWALWIFTPNLHSLIELQAGFYSLQTIKLARVTATFLTIYILYWWSQRIGAIRSFVLPRPQKERRVFIHQRSIDLRKNHLYPARQCAGRSNLQRMATTCPWFSNNPNFKFLSCCQSRPPICDQRINREEGSH